MRYLVLCLLVVACRESVTAPKTPELSCGNAITPPTFRTVRATDTTLWTNRYAVPHRYADTLLVEGSGPPVLLVFPHGGSCTLLSDSLIIWHGDSHVIP